MAVGRVPGLCLPPRSLLPYEMPFSVIVKCSAERSQLSSIADIVHNEIHHEDHSYSGIGVDEHRQSVAVLAAETPFCTRQVFMQCLSALG